MENNAMVIAHAIPAEGILFQMAQAGTAGFKAVASSARTNPYAYVGAALVGCSLAVAAGARGLLGSAVQSGMKQMVVSNRLMLARLIAPKGVEMTLTSIQDVLNEIDPLAAPAILRREPEAAEAFAAFGPKAVKANGAAAHA